MKKIIFLIVCLLLTGCTNDIEDIKNTYLTYKNDLQEEHEFLLESDLPCDITISIDKINDEEVSYRAIIDNPKVNMYNIKAMVIHNYFSEDIFPTIGIFDDNYDLLIDNDEVKGLSLVGYIKTDKDIKDLDLEVRLLIEYLDEDLETKIIYYKTT